MDRALRLLRRIGMRSKYAGYQYLAYAVTLVLENPDYLRNVTKHLYVQVGEKYQVSGTCVEAAIRSLISIYWNQNNDKIIRTIVGYPLFDRPTSSEFISILADYLRENPKWVM